jgi:two-component system capsular synthesis response regulator RcsB
MPAQLAIVEDSLLVRKGLVAIVNGLIRRPGGLSGHAHETGEYEVVADVSSAQELQRLLANQPIDLLLLDYSLAADAGNIDSHPLHAMDGHALIKWVRKQYPATRIITVSSHCSPIIIRMAFEAGATGYVSKGATEAVLGHAIVAVMKNEVYIEHRFLKDMLNKNPLEVSVSPREMEVLRLISKGFRLTEVARQMHLSIKTVSAHKLRAMEKLGVSSDLELHRLTTVMAL